MSLRSPASRAPRAPPHCASPSASTAAERCRAHHSLRLRYASPALTPAASNRAACRNSCSTRWVRKAASVGEPLSILRLIVQASVPVQVVIAILLLASLTSWAIIFRKRAVISRARREADRFEDRFWSGDD